MVEKFMELFARLVVAFECIANAMGAAVSAGLAPTSNQTPTQVPGPAPDSTTETFDSETDLDALKAQAATLGLSFPARTRAVTYRKGIAEELARRENAGAPAQTVPVGMGTAPAASAQAAPAQTVPVGMGVSPAGSDGTLGVMGAGTPATDAGITGMGAAPATPSPDMLGGSSAPAPVEYSQDDVRAALVDLITRKGGEATGNPIAFALLQKRGCTSITQLKPDQYAEIISEAKAS